jgi:hypothetical protein
MTDEFQLKCQSNTCVFLGFLQSHHENDNNEIKVYKFMRMKKTRDNMNWKRSISKILEYGKQMSK